MDQGELGRGRGCIQEHDGVEGRGRGWVRDKDWAHDKGPVIHGGGSEERHVGRV